MLDRNTFLRPIAHRGLHDAAKGIIENTTAAFEAAIAKGYGIECDLRAAGCATPMVFHDLTLDRLVEAEGPIARHEAAALKRLAYRNVKGAMLELAELFELVGGRVPLLIEIKSEWEAPEARYLNAIAKAAQSYKKPVALMSFDPAVMTGIRELAPEIPRGIVSGQFAADCWWRDQLGPQRALDLSNLLESGPAAPDFYAYDVNALPTPVTRFAREVEGLPLFTWTVRSEEQRATAARWADAPIFEGYEP